MSAWVIDASFALALGLPDESSASAQRGFSSLPEGARIVVPALWWYEVSNGLATAQRKGRITPSQGERIADLVSSIPLETDGPSAASVLASSRRLALEHALSAYDASYLELAQRVGACLCTFDDKLRSAATRSGVPLLPLP